MKKCNKCNEKKPLTEFHKNKTTKDGKERKCKSCYKKQGKKYYKDNSELILKKVKIYRENNLEKITEYKKIYHLNNNKHILKTTKQWKLNNPDKVKEHSKKNYEINKDKIKNYSKKWRDNNPEYHKNHRDSNPQYYREYGYQRYNNDPKFKLKYLLRCRIYQSIKNKSNSSMELLGCDIETYYNYLEKQFTKDMTWDNHGKVWEIDHTIPLNTFDLEDEGEQFKAFNYMNTRPLPITENRSRPKDGSDLV